MCDPDPRAPRPHALVLSNNRLRGNTRLFSTLATGWINDMYYGGAGRSALRVLRRYGIICSPW